MVSIDEMAAILLVSHPGNVHVHTDIMAQGMISGSTVDGNENSLTENEPLPTKWCVRIQQ